MKNKDVFDFDYYKEFLNYLVGGPGKRTGKRQEMAKACDCNTAFVSQVLNGNGHLSLEQGQKIFKHFRLSKEEGHYFLLLIQRARAGTTELKRYFDEQLTEIQNRRLHLKERLKLESKITKEDQARYYSRWYYSSIHSLVSIPELQTKEKLAEYLGLPIATIAEGLTFLVESGLVTYENGRYTSGKLQIHLEKESYHIGKHHSNWRMRAIASLDRDTSEDIHYSAVLTCKKKGIEEIRQRLVSEIKGIVETVSQSPSPDEEGCALVIDLFGLRS